MKRPVKVDLYGMEGHGRNITEAKENAGEQIRQVLDGRWEPACILAGNLVAFIWREPGGWGYRIVSASESRMFHNCVSDDDYKETERACRMHLAQNLMDMADPKSFDLSMSVVENHKDRREHAHYIEWQVCFRAWHDAGVDRDECHRLCGSVGGWGRTWPDGVEPFFYHLPEEENNGGTQPNHAYADA